jgi:phosphotransacetylase
MRDVLAILRVRAPHLQVDGEMHGGLALDHNLRRKVMPDSTLEGDANLLVLPNIDAANISYNLTAGCGSAGTRITPVSNGSPDRQYDGAAGGGCCCAQVAAALKYQLRYIYALSED